MADNQGGGSGGRDSRDLVQKKESMAIRIVLDRLNPKDAFKHRRDAEKDGPPKYDNGKLSQALETVELTDPFHSRVDKVFFAWVRHLDGLDFSQIRLIEEGRMMRKISKIYSCMVDAAVKDVMEAVGGIKSARYAREIQLEKEPEAVATADRLKLKYSLTDFSIRIEMLTNEQILLLSAPQHISDDASPNGQGSQQMELDSPIVDDPPVPEPPASVNNDNELISGQEQVDVELQLDNQEAYQSNYDLRSGKRVAIMGRTFGWSAPKKRRPANHNEAINEILEIEVEMDVDVDEIEPVLLDAPMIAVLVGCEDVGIIQDQPASNATTSNTAECARPISVRKAFFDKILAINVSDSSMGKSFENFVAQVRQVYCTPPRLDLVFEEIDKERDSSHRFSRRSSILLLKKEMSIQNSEAIKTLAALPRLAFLHEGIQEKMKKATAELELKVDLGIGQSAANGGEILDCNNEKHDAKALGFELLTAIANEQARVKRESVLHAVAPLKKLSQSQDSGFSSQSEIDPSSPTQLSGIMSAPWNNSEFSGAGASNAQWSQDSGIAVDDHDEVELSGKGWIQPENGDIGVNANCIFDGLSEVPKMHTGVGTRICAFLQEMSTGKVTTISRGKVEDGISLTSKGNEELAMQIRKKP